jgi:ubiquinone/menaquinone biosynthesis C-methylase UbiE
MWHRVAVHSRRAAVLADHFADLIPPNHSVLDVGSGDGLIAALILQRRPDLTIQGVDVLERPAAQIAVTRFDGQRLPFADRSFETVMLCDVLHHTERPVQMLEEATRVARHTVIIKDHLVRGVLARPTLRLMDFIGNAPHGVVLPYNYLTDEEWTRAFQACGLNRREERRLLRLYPLVADWIFGRSLHFISSFDVPQGK